MERKKLSKATKKDFVNSEMALDIVKVSQAHIKLVAFILFKAKIIPKNDIPMKTFKNKNNIEIMSYFCKLYGLVALQENKLTGLYQCGYFQAGIDYSDIILDAIKKMNLLIRPNILNVLEAVASVEEFNMSAIGNAYGDIYETHLEWAKNSRMNSNVDAIPDGYLEYMMPLLKGKM